MNNANISDECFLSPKKKKKKKIYLIKFFSSKFFVKFAFKFIPHKKTFTFELFSTNHVITISLILTHEHHVTQGGIHIGLTHTISNLIYPIDSIYTAQIANLEKYVALYSDFILFI